MQAYYGVYSQLRITHFRSVFQLLLMIQSTPPFLYPYYQLEFISSIDMTCGFIFTDIVSLIIILNNFSINDCLI